MKLSQSLRKMIVLGVSGAVVVTGTAFADEHLTGEDPAPVEEAPVEDVAVEEVPVEDAPLEEVPVEEALVEDAPVEDAPLEDAPVEDAPLEDAPVDEALVSEDVETATDDAEEVVEDAAHPDNHGAVVSEAAQSPTPEGFRNHGEFVSSVARGDHGPAADDTAEVDESEQETAAEDDTTDEATSDAGPGHGKGHGKGKNK